MSLPIKRQWLIDVPAPDQLEQPVLWPEPQPRPAPEPAPREAT